MLVVPLEPELAHRNANVLRDQTWRRKAILGGTVPHLSLAPQGGRKAGRPLEGVAEGAL